MRSTPVEDLIENSDSITDEDVIENDIVQLQNDIRESSYESPQFQNEINQMRSELEELKARERNKVPSKPTEIPEDSNSMIEDIFRYKKKKDLLEIICLLAVYVLFSLNNVNEIIDNLIPYMFYNYTLLIKGVLFILLYRSLNVFLGKLDFMS